MKENKRILKRKERGITLIALVITIIVLLILAGVSISMLTGDNGILTQAQNAKNKTEEAARKEEQDLAELEALITGKDVVITPVHDDNPGELEGEGTENKPFVINSIEDLVFFSHDVTNGNDYNGKIVKLGTNLDFNSDKSYVDPNSTDYEKYGYNGPLKQSLTSGTGFIPIGSQDEKNNFYGTFDGNNNAICSLYINTKTDDMKNIGLFSTSYGEIKNLGLVDVKIEGSKITKASGLVAQCYNNIYNCYVSGSINVIGNSWMDIGGLCGEMRDNKNIKNCYNLATIYCKNEKETAGDADISCGGIIGRGYNIDKCYNKGNIVTSGGINPIYLGGIAGHISSGFISNCYNSGYIKGINGNLEGENHSVIGGVVGRSLANNIKNCYNYGDVVTSSKTNSKIGGIIGVQTTNSIISNIFNIGKIIIEYSNVYSVGGILGVRDGNNNIEMNNIYNIGKITADNINPADNRGAITGTNILNLITFNNCYYLESSYDIGVNYGSSKGITELDSIDKFPSVLEVVNGEGAFEEDSSNVNNGYPVLKMD